MIDADPKAGRMFAGPGNIPLIVVRSDRPGYGYVAGTLFLDFPDPDSAKILVACTEDPATGKPRQYAAFTDASGDDALMIARLDDGTVCLHVPGSDSASPGAAFTLAELRVLAASKQAAERFNAAPWCPDGDAQVIRFPGLGRDDAAED